MGELLTPVEVLAGTNLGMRGERVVRHVRPRDDCAGRPEQTGGGSVVRHGSLEEPEERDVEIEALSIRGMVAGILQRRDDHDEVGPKGSRPIEPTS